MMERIEKLEGELKGRDERINILVEDNTDLSNKVMTWEAEALAAKGFLKEVELARDEEIARVTEAAVAEY